MMDHVGSNGDVQRDRAGAYELVKGQPSQLGPHNGLGQTDGTTACFDLGHGHTVALDPVLGHEVADVLLTKSGVNTERPKPRCEVCVKGTKTPATFSHVPDSNTGVLDG